MARGAVKIEGLRETEEALRALGKSLGKGVLRRVGMKALTPMRDQARAMAPNDPETPENIAETIIISTKRPAGEKSEATRAFARTRGMGGSTAQARAAAKAAGAGSVMVYMGPNRDPKAVQQEFGNVNHGPQPFMRPAWDAQKVPALEGIKDDLWVEIEKTAKRKARREARAKG